MTKKNIEKIFEIIKFAKKNTIYSENEIRKKFKIQYRTIKKIDFLFTIQRRKNIYGKARIEKKIKEKYIEVIDFLIDIKKQKNIDFLKKLYKILNALFSSKNNDNKGNNY